MLQHALPVMRVAVIADIADFPGMCTPCFFVDDGSDRC